MSHIMVTAMMILVSLHVLVVLSSVHAAHLHKGLSCVNDFVNNVSCTWDRSAVSPGVDCWIFGMKKTWISMRDEGTIIRSCKLIQHRNSTPGCSFVFEKEEFNSYSSMPFIRVECNGTLMENMTNYKPANHIKMHPPGVPNVSSTANETRISWSPGSPPSRFFKAFQFHIQIKQEHKTWKEARTLSTQEREVRILNWEHKGHCQVRVRVKTILQNSNWSNWSNWSPTTSWAVATDVVATSQHQEWLLSQTTLIKGGVLLSFIFAVIAVAMVLYRNCASRGLLKGKPVPNPSKYFHTLHSVHEGNLKKWLNPKCVSESFFEAQPLDPISSVEVCESWDVVPSTSPSCRSTSALLHFSSYPSAGSDSSGVVDNSTSSSCFSNVGYLISSSSGSSARTDPNPAYFTYKEDFHNKLHLALCPPLGTSPTYESLKREPQSPDSGFGIGKEDDEGEEDKEVEDDHPPLLILPLKRPSWMCPPSSAPPPPNLPPISSDSHQVDVPVAAPSGSYSAWPTAMCRSSSMPVEPSKTGYMTLKELQTTFSNKSI